MKNEKKKSKLVSFSMRQSGGIAGIDVRYATKFTDLKADDCAKLKHLIEDSGLLSVDKENRQTGGAADMFLFEFIADDGKQHKAVFDNGTLPAKYQPLVQWVRKRTNRQR